MTGRGQFTTGYKRDADLDKAHQRGEHAEILVFGCHHCTELVHEYEARIIEEREDPDIDLDSIAGGHDSDG